MEATISKALIHRLSGYMEIAYRYLTEGAVHVSSGKIAKYAGNSASQVRNDLARMGICAGQVRNEAGEMIRQLKRCLGIEKGKKFALIGNGGPGAGIASSRCFHELGMELVLCCTPEDPNEPIEGLKDCIAGGQIDVAILNDRSLATEAVLELLEQEGVCAVWNVTDTELLPEERDNILVENTDLAASLLSLSCRLAQRNDEKSSEKAGKPSPQGACETKKGML